MALYDCATVKRIDRSYNKRMIRVDGIIHHIAVSNSLFPSYLPGTNAHFYIRKDGTICQEIDTAFASGANLEGNYYYLSAETEGGVGDDVNNGWTDAQIASLARLDEEASRREGFPLRLMENSFNGERGVGWHRLGIDGNFPGTGILRGRQQRGGGRKFSKSRGKICPTDARIIQMPRILTVALGGPVKPKPNPVIRQPNTWQREQLAFLGFADTHAFQSARTLFPDGDMGPITADVLTREYDMTVQQINERLAGIEKTVNSLHDDRIHQVVGHELRTVKGRNPDGTERAKPFVDDLADTAIKTARRDLRYMLFELEDGRKGIQNVDERTWSLAPDDATLNGALDVLRYQGNTIADAPWGNIRTWGYVRGIPGVKIQDPYRLGRQVEWKPEVVDVQPDDHAPQTPPATTAPEPVLTTQQGAALAAAGDAPLVG